MGWLVLMLAALAGQIVGDDEVGSRAIPQQQVTWKQGGVSDQLAQSYRYRLYIVEESGVSHIVPLGSTLCGGVDPYASECSTVLPKGAESAVITGNYSSLTATDPTSGIESILSAPYVGDQGCIFRNRLYDVGQRRSLTVMVKNLDALLAEFRAAKFKHVSTVKVDAIRVRVLEECVGYLVY